MYGLVGFGFVSVFKTNRILNFAHAPVAAAGAVVMSSLLTDGALGIERFRGLNPITSITDGLAGWLLALVLALLAAGALSAGIERVAIRPMRSYPVFIVTIVTIGVSIVVQRITDQAPIARSIDLPWGSQTTIGSTSVTVSTVVVIVSAAGVLLALTALDHTRPGIGLRALGEDEEAALAQGINRERLVALAWAIAGITGTLAAIGFTLPPRGLGLISSAATPALFLRAIPVLAIGGWDSYRGVYVAGLGVGLLQTLSGGLLARFTPVLGAGYSTVLPFIAMLIVLLIRPTGLFGKPVIRRV